MKPRYKLVAFDFDGTLADSFATFLWAMEQAAARHGFRSIDHADLEELRGYSGRQMMKYLGIPPWKVPRIGVDMKRLMLEKAGEIRLFDGIAALLRALADAGIDVAVVTSNIEANVRAVLKDENVQHVKYFECGASIFGKSTKLKRLLRLSGHTAADVLCVGDETRDYEAAKASGMDFVGVSWGYTRRDVLQRHSDMPLVEQAAGILALVEGRDP